MGKMSPLLTNYTLSLQVPPPRTARSQTVETMTTRAARRRGSRGTRTTTR